MTPLEIRKLTPEDIPSFVPLLTHLNPEVPHAVLEKRFHELFSEHPHYHAFGAFIDGRPAGIAGAWIATKIWCGLYLEIDNLVVDPAQRSSGIGTALIRHLEDFGRERGCLISVLDSYASNRASHRLYHRMGYEIYSFHFVKPIGAPTA